ncbi:unnamed protein product [Rotaria socialis]|uniref:Uncharacterized protein n=2 Tax=Rotaria socialis TaxID=392032 RepID=A0A817XPV4_9BILA|nr:unnamed protein product [Rotaria socialis]
MSLKDVSNDRLMIDWLRQAGHGHLLDERIQNTNFISSPPSASIPFGQTTSSSNYPPQTTSLFSVSPPFNTGFPGAPPMNTINRTAPILQTDFNPTARYDGAATLSPSPLPIGSSSFGQHQDSSHFNSPSPAQLLAPNRNERQLDVDIENMKRDPNTRIVQRPPQEDIVYKQRVFVRYLQPPTPPVGGTIIVREKQPPAPAPDPPIVIKRAPPAPPTPPPVTIRERPPPIPPAEGTTVIDKLVPPGPKPARQVIIEQYPPLPPKPQDVIIERWLPVQPRTRRILYERLPPSNQPATRPIIVQYGPPQVRVKREVVVTPGVSQLPYQQVAGQTDINQILNQLGGNQPLSSLLSPSSLGAYNPYSTIQPNYSSLGQPQSNIVIMQNGQPSTLPSSSYGVPLTCVCTPNKNVGLGAYGSGVSTTPVVGQSPGQTMVYNIPENVPVDNILRQLGIDPYSIQRSGGSPFPDSHNALANVWNAASHANPSYPINPNSAVSHVWNAAAHNTDFNRPASPSSGRAWEKIDQYLHKQDALDAVRSVWNHAAHPNAQPSQSNYPPLNYPPPNYPPPSSNYPPPSSSYPPPNYPPPSSNYPPPSPSYSPPPASYPPPPRSYPPPNYSPSSYPPPPSSSYPPPPSSSYPPPPSSSYPPPQPGGAGGAGSSVLSRLFGGGR